MILTDRVILAIYLTKPEVALILQEVHDHISYFGSKIVLNGLRFQVFWPKIVIDVYKYIFGYLPYVKWAITA